jgi:hypothetical protein
LRVLDGVTGELRYAAPNTTFTATEALIVADVDGDGHAEVVRVSNSANWDCDQLPWTEHDAITGRPAWEPPTGQNYYKGITVFGDATNSWVGTRTVWNQHAYYVSNICDGSDGACDPGEGYGRIPSHAKDNWRIGWLNNFRENVKSDGVLDAPDATVSLRVSCTDPIEIEVAVRNAGFAALPAGVGVGVFAGVVRLGDVLTTQKLLPGQTQLLPFEVPAGLATLGDTFVARIEIDPGAPLFVECREDNNESAQSTAVCTPG